MEGKDKFLFTIYNSVDHLDVVSIVHDHEVWKLEEEDEEDFKIKTKKTEFARLRFQKW